MTRWISIPAGDEVVEALREACRETDGWVQAAGVVEAVELRLAGEGTDPTRALRGRLTLASLVGPAGGPYGVTLARATDAGIEVLAGELVRARSAGVNGALLTLGEAREQPRSNGAPRESAPARTPTAAALGSSAWATAAMTSARAARANAEPEPEVILPLPGDLVQHFAFGLCEVLMGDDERLKIRDVGGPGRIREILLDMLNIRGPTDKDGKRLFKLERRS